MIKYVAGASVGLAFKPITPYVADLPAVHCFFIVEYPADIHHERLGNPR